MELKMLKNIIAIATITEFIMWRYVSSNWKTKYKSAIVMKWQNLREVKEWKRM